MDKNIESQTINDVFSAIKPASAKWESIGSELGLYPATIEEIKDKHLEPQQCMFHVLKFWLHHKDDSFKKGIKWRTLIKALKSVNEKDLAETVIQEKGFTRRGVTKPTVPQIAEVLKVNTSQESQLSKGFATITLSPLDLAWFLHRLTEIASRWETFGLYLGIPHYELKNIASRPLLLHQAPISYLRETLDLWLRQCPTAESLISALEKLTYVGLSENIQQQIIQDEHRTDKIAGAPLKELQTDLKSHYLRKSQQSNEWPPTLKVKYVNLLLTKQTKLTNRSMPLLVEEASIFKAGNIKNIVDSAARFCRQEISLEDIIDYHDAEENVTIIEGAPGIGKTTLANKICQDWASNRLLTNVSLVLYFPLLAPKVRLAETIDDLLKYYCSFDDIQFIRSAKGKGVLFILDGWDELPPSCRYGDMFFPNFLQGNILSKCSIIVTSRPLAAAEIKLFANQEVEILGFTDKQVEEYIHLYFKDYNNASEVAGKLLEELDTFPNVLSTCYVAINLTIVCYVYSVSQYSLPSTLTEIYHHFIIHAIKRHLSKTTENITLTSDVFEIDSLNNFDKPVSELLRSLANLAFNGIQSDEIVFTRKELFNLCHVDQSDRTFDGFGLLKPLFMLQSTGTRIYYHFLHLTVQEFFAAYYIYHMKEDDQGDILTQIFEDSRYELVVKFFCGLNQFKSCPARTIFCNKQNVDSRFALECIYEGQYEKACETVADITCHSLTFRTQIQPYQALVYGFVMTKSKTKWDIYWNYCTIGDRELKILSRCLKDFPQTLGKIVLMKSLLSSTHSASLLSQIIKKQELSELILFSLELDEESLDNLFKGICGHKTIATLRINKCTVTEKTSRIIAHFLSETRSLHILDFSGSNFVEDSWQNNFLASSSIRELHLPAVLKELVTDFLKERKEIEVAIQYH